MQYGSDVTALAALSVMSWTEPQALHPAVRCGKLFTWGMPGFCACRAFRKKQTEQRGVAQLESSAQIKRRTVVRAHPPRPLFRLAWAERLGLPECPYVIRWRVEAPPGSLRVHHWLAPDDDRAYHDHPWWFITLVLRGGYTDRSPAGDDHLRAPAVRLRRALHQHTVIPDADGCWTLLLTGPVRRRWGFWVKGKFRKASRYFYMYGHHPCTGRNEEQE